jgi:glucose dehydrogenase
MNWSSVSHDPGRGLVIANTNRLAFAVTLVPRDRYQAGAGDRGAAGS